MSVFAIVFWLWVMVSLVVLVKRQVSKRGKRPTPVVSAVDPSEAPPTSHTPSPVSSPETTLDVDDVEQAPGDHPDEGSANTPEDGTDGARAVVRAMLAEQQAGRAVSAPETVPTGPSGASDEGRPAAPGRSVAAARQSNGLSAALDGIRLPCDLAPLTLSADSPDPDHLDLVTKGHPSAIVASELGDELERLDFEMSDLGGGEYLATRDQTVIRVRVHDRPAVSVAEDGRGFSTADPDSIVVEISIA